MDNEGEISEGPPGQNSSQKEWQQRQSQQKSQTPQPQQRTQPPVREGVLKRITSNSFLTKMIALGFILLLLGVLVMHAAPFVTNWDGAELGASHDEDYGEDKILTEKEKQDDRAFENAMEYTGRMISDIGIFFIGLFLALGGISRDDLDTKYRMVMVSLSVLLILVAWFGFLTAVPIALPG